MLELIFSLGLIWAGGIQEGPDGFPPTPPVYADSVIRTGGDPGVEVTGSCLGGEASRNTTQGACCRLCMNRPGTKGVLMSATCTVAVNLDGTTTTHAECTWAVHPYLGGLR
jgi:hypothetical protein